MSVYRTYFEKDNTLINKSRVNTGRNECTDLTYGNIPARVSPNFSGETIFTRYILKINIGELKSILESDHYSRSAITKHTLRLYNTIAIRKDLAGNENPYGADRAYDFRLRVYRLEEDFAEGFGHDFRYDNTFTTEQTFFNENNTSVSNWFDRQIDTPWATEGAITQTGSTLVADQYFQFGYENAEFDVTEDINAVLDGTRSHFGYAVVFEPDLEGRDDDRLNTVNFFSRLTNTFFEPHLETAFNDVIYDDSLYSNSVRAGGDTFYFEARSFPTLITLYRDCGTEVGIFNASVVKPPLYSVYIPFREDLPTFENYTLEYVPTGSTLVCSEDFTLVPGEACLPIPPSDLSNVYLDYRVYGIKHNERISRGQVRRVVVNPRDVNNKVYAYPIKWRIYTMQGRNVIEVTPFESVNRLNMVYYFFLDTRWLIPRDYVVEIKCFNGESEAGTAQLVPFRIESEKVDFFTNRL